MKQRIQKLNIMQFGLINALNCGFFCILITFRQIFIETNTCLKLTAISNDWDAANTQKIAGICLKFFVLKCRRLFEMLKSWMIEIKTCRLLNLAQVPRYMSW